MSSQFVTMSMIDDLNLSEILKLLSNLTDEQLKALDEQKYAESLFYIYNTK